MRYQQIIHIPSTPIKIERVENAKITIAIPTYRRAILLREAIDSCLQQKTNIPFNILIVDNDPQRNCETEELIASYVSKNISYYKNTENLGPTGNWNKLFELAQTDFVVILHDDDKLEDDYIQKIDKVLKYYQEKIDAIYVETRVFPFTSRIFPRKHVSKLKTVSLTPLDFQFFNAICITGACFNREIIINLNGFDENFYPPIDYEMHLRLSKKKKIIKILNYPLTLYRVSENDSMKWSTITSLNIKDREIQNSIIQNRSSLYKKLFRIYQKNRELLHFIGTKKVFKVNTPEINEKITELKNKITFIDKLIFLGWRVFIKLHFILKPKTTIKL
ncbi:glycosyltransferase family 2 protein [Capnocytophaga leadbetteri]|uniref:glycosyltransferase family 2 protein n=1 Tax=Capnocytophaga leadbetteri TaxID=327575 RepID=UPI0028E9819A|nr:glycosyltransferase family 2 protein [Capnocytophaga leadbetteri]